MTIERIVTLQKTRKGYYQATIPIDVVEEYEYSKGDKLKLRATKRGIRLMKGETYEN